MNALFIVDLVLNFFMATSDDITMEVEVRHWVILKLFLTYLTIENRQKLFAIMVLGRLDICHPI